MSKSVLVIGAGFAGLASAVQLASQGFDVEIFEKNPTPGGRARCFSAEGYTFDMGPSWYWMPDVIERFFQSIGKSVHDYIDLVRLNPGYRIFTQEDKFYDVPATDEELFALFEKLEPGSSQRLKSFLADAQVKYQLGMGKAVYISGNTVREFIDGSLIGKLFRLSNFRSHAKHIRRYFSHPVLIRMLEFPVLFLGATPENTPALYSLMNYADLKLGTWYPKGGMFKLVEALVSICDEMDIPIHYNANVEQLDIVKNKVSCLIVNKKAFTADYFVASADYHHIDSHLLPSSMRNYSEAYWENRTLAPSAMLFYLGFDRKFENLLHHNLFFDTDFDTHAKAIYDNPQWPRNPAMYVSCTSRTDPSVAPEGHENVVVLIPVAPNLKETGKVREHYFAMVLEKLSLFTGTNVAEHLTYHHIYGQTDFIHDYNAYKGNAYGLANTLRQTAILKPSMCHRKLKNLFYTGQLTVPGPGVPPALVSGQLVKKEILRRL